MFLRPNAEDHSQSAYALQKLQPAGEQKHVKSITTPVLEAKRVQRGEMMPSAQAGSRPEEESTNATNSNRLAGTADPKVNPAVSEYFNKEIPGDRSEKKALVREASFIALNRVQASRGNISRQNYTNKYVPFHKRKKYTAPTSKGK